MEANGHHCPFLDRSDSRCSSYFSLDRLDHAFGYCFGSYRQCPVYLEMLAERRLRRMTGATHAAAGVVQLTIPDRYAKQPAHRAGVPAAPGF